MFIRMIPTPERLRQKEVPELSCDHCSTTYMSKNAWRDLHKRTKHFCSKDCSNNSRKIHKDRSEFRTCLHCKTQFKERNRGAILQTYCSRKCRALHSGKRRESGSSNCVCNICKNTFHDPRSTSKFCQQCAPDLHWLQIAKRYNLSKSQFEFMFAQQQGRCKICDRKQGDKGCQHLCIDHCHKTGIVRGLLCYSCNTMLGVLELRPEFFTRAQAYLTS